MRKVQIPTNLKPPGDNKAWRNILSKRITRLTSKSWNYPIRHREKERERDDNVRESKRARGVHSRENREPCGEEENLRERETEGRGGKKETVTPRSARSGLDNRDVSRAKNRPGTPGPTAIVVGVCIGERASERRGRARGSERLRCARAIFRPRKRSAWVSQPGYLVRARAGARHDHFAAREQAKSRVAAELQGARVRHAGLSGCSLFRKSPSDSATHSRSGTSLIGIVNAEWSIGSVWRDDFSSETEMIRLPTRIRSDLWVALSNRILDAWIAVD